MSNSSATVGVPVGSAVRINFTAIAGLLLAVLLGIAIGIALASNDVSGPEVLNPSNSVDYPVRHPNVRVGTESKHNVDYGLRHLSVPVAPDPSRSVDFGIRHLTVPVPVDPGRSVDYAVRHLNDD